MNTTEKIKRIILIILALSISAYLMYSGFKILNYKENNQTKEIK